MSSPRHTVGARLAVAALVLPVLTAVVTGPTSPAAAGHDPARPEVSRAASAPAHAGSEGIGDDYWPLDGNGGIDVLHYDINDSYDFAGGRLEGSTTLTIRATESLTRFQLDFLLPVTAVYVDGVPAVFSRPAPHELRIRPATPLPKGTDFTALVEYAGEPGPISYARESNWLADGNEVVTMNEPHMAPWWFPANDHPTDKALFDITITGPATHQVVSNGLPVDRTVEGDLATTHWRSTDPMATYLAFFALGRYDIREGTRGDLPWYVAVSRDLPDGIAAASMRSLRRSAAITAWLDRRLGPYPFESTGGVASSLNPWFALENQTRPTYSRGMAMDRPTVVHELAHQWFGDSVSVRRWRDIWLNEGFASFMEVAYAEKHHGQRAQRWLRQNYDFARYDDYVWSVDLTDPGPRHIFHSSVYYRGAMALQALRHLIGERDFWSLLRTWLSARRHSTGSVPAFQRLAEEVSGRELDEFFRVWLRAKRPPERTAANGLR